MTTKVPRVQIAHITAAQVLDEHQVDRLPVCPTAIAEACGIQVQEKPPENDGFSGMLARVGETFGILYATHVPSRGFQRFSVAHELGHYFLPGHIDSVLAGGFHQSRAEFSTSDPYEVEADLFASALLMPPNLFKRELVRVDDGLTAVKLLAEKCETSLTATAITFARHTRAAVGVVQSTDGVVDFCSFSEAMKDAGVRWLRKGDLVPTDSLTAHFSGDRSRVDAADEDAVEAPLTRWFENARPLRAREEVIGLGRYGRVLSIITCPRIGLESEGYDDDDEEEADLMERWAVRHRP